MESTQACSNFGREKEAIHVHTEDNSRVYFLPIVTAYTEQGKQGLYAASGYPFMHSPYCLQ